MRAHVNACPCVCMHQNIPFNKVIYKHMQGVVDVRRLSDIHGRDSESIPVSIVDAYAAWHAHSGIDICIIRAVFNGCIVYILLLVSNINRPMLLIKTLIPVSTAPLLLLCRATSPNTTAMGGHSSRALLSSAMARFTRAPHSSGSNHINYEAFIYAGEPLELPASEPLAPDGLNLATIAHPTSGLWHDSRLNGMLLGSAASDGNEDSNAACEVGMDLSIHRNRHRATRPATATEDQREDHHRHVQLEMGIVELVEWPSGQRGREAVLGTPGFNVAPSTATASPRADFDQASDSVSDDVVGVIGSFGRQK